MNLKVLVKKIRANIYYSYAEKSLRHANYAIFIPEKKGLLESRWKKMPVRCYSPGTRVRKSNFDLSIIVPLYNSEGFIAKLLDSVINQETQYKYELILVDDGSTDNTSTIASERSKGYDNIRYIRQSNGGISSARNTGIKNATGKYLCFLDHDDYIDKRFVDELLNLAYKNNADIVKCGTANVRSGRIISSDARPDAVITGKMEWEIFDCLGYIWGGIYKASLFNGVYFPEHYWFEDMINRPLLYWRADSFINTQSILHFRTIHDNQTSKKVWSSSSYKSLEQLYLIEQIVKDTTDPKANLSLDAFFYMIVLHECSEIMVGRIDCLDDSTKEQVFIRVRNLLKHLYKQEYAKYLIGHWKIKNDIILGNRYDLWKLEKNF